MPQENKRTKSAKYMSNVESIFACPICHASMEIVDDKSLICSNKHTFDLAKQGYVNLTTQHVKTKYNKELFEARRNLITKGAFFEPLSHKISEIIFQHFSERTETLAILDAGCGEGSHLTHIHDLVRSHLSHDVLGVGIDISKEGIAAASKNYPNKIWAVADLAKTPFRSEQFDLILNILSPSNYAEFHRLLKNDGLVIKVVPQTNYLKELREELFGRSEKQNYSNVETVENFNENFQISNKTRLSYITELDQSSMKWLIEMTPLTWTRTEEQLNSFLNNDATKITVDVDILIGKANHLKN